MAPIVMLQHSWYVVSILAGIATGWNTQTRTDRALPLALVARQFAPHTLIGVAATAILWRAAPAFQLVPAACWPGCGWPFRWCVISSSPHAGAGGTARKACSWCPAKPTAPRCWGAPMPWPTAMAKYRKHRRNWCWRMHGVRDLHLALLAGTPPANSDPARLGVLRAQAARRETAGFSRDDWALLLSDAEGLKALS